MIPPVDQNGLITKLIEKVDNLENRINEKDKQAEAEKLEWKEKADRVNDYIRYKANADCCVNCGLFFILATGSIGFSAYVIGVPALSTVISTLGLTDLIVIPMIFSGAKEGISNDVILGGIIHKNPHMTLEEAKKKLFEITKTQKTILNSYDLKYV